VTGRFEQLSGAFRPRSRRPDRHRRPPRRGRRQSQQPV